ncbi:hypothetical protein EDB85DRAFT_2212910 [Lactarius pseudohatsudake]|nr:hypothetical protein EDB85DRAFT_2212910 [Lactarius pseudohatsudake]
MDHPGLVDENIPRHRSNIGVAPETLKAAYLSLAGLLYAGDFYDFVGIGAPLLLASLSPTAVLRVVQDSLATCQPLEAVEDWFDPVRHTLAWYFGAPEEDTAAGTRTVTYLAQQDGLEGKRLRAADHVALLDVLAGLARTGVTVHVVDEKTSWMKQLGRELVVQRERVLGDDAIRCDGIYVDGGTTHSAESTAPTSMLRPHSRTPSPQHKSHQAALQEKHATETDTLLTALVDTEVITESLRTDLKYDTGRHTSLDSMLSTKTIVFTRDKGDHHCAGVDAEDNHHHARVDVEDSKTISTAPASMTKTITIDTALVSTTKTITSAGIDNESDHNSAVINDKGDQLGTMQRLG